MSSSMAIRPQQSPLVISPSVVPSAPTPPPSAALPVDFATLNINGPSVVPPPPSNSGRDRESQLLRRVRELEDELRIVRAENEKQVRIFNVRVLSIYLILHFPSRKR